MKSMNMLRKVLHYSMCVLLLISSDAYGQYSHSTKYKAQSFEDMIGPYVLATQEYKKTRK